MRSLELLGVVAIGLKSCFCPPLLELDMLDIVEDADVVRSRIDVGDATR
jgi:hypothetical protein